jgi:integrase
MRLLEIARLYLANNLGLSPAYKADLLSVARRCSEHAGCLNGSIPTTEQIAAWFASSLQRGISPKTLLRYRRNLVALINFGTEVEMCVRIRIPKVKPKPTVPKAWTFEEFEKVLNEAARSSGYIGRVRACDWWPAVLLTLY